jgi:hypothetical protein
MKSPRRLLRIAYGYADYYGIREARKLYYTATGRCWYCLGRHGQHKFSCYNPKARWNAE